MSLEIPETCNLPYFSYGCFQPTEPAHRQIEDFLSMPPQLATIDGQLLVRDGLPLLDTTSKSTLVRGWLLTFKAEASQAAYAVISEFEPNSLYCWEQVTLLEPDCPAMCIVGRKLGRGNALPLDVSDHWTHLLDPVLGMGMEILAEAVNKFSNYEFQAAPPEFFEWRQFFDVQKNYLLLWSALERYCSLAYGPALRPGEKIGHLARDSAFAEALADSDVTKRRIFDSRNPNTKYVLTEDDPRSACNYYYQVRSNLSHRGKGAYSDGEAVRLSFCELHAIMTNLLAPRTE